jgi:dTDP-4-amino-4,6-dideoxy-D-galactose acyltransferase
VYVFSSIKLDYENLKLVDTKLTFSKDLKKMIIPQDGNLQLFKKGKHNFEKLEKLALVSGEFSRFKLDDNFNKNDYHSLYKQWIYNSVYKQKALNTMIYTEENKILGFTTLEKKTNLLCDISLVAVDEKARGKKIGRKLIDYTIFQASNKHFNKIQVVTQQNNIPAVGLYKKCGFRLTKTEYIYHYWRL